MGDLLASAAVNSATLSDDAQAICTCVLAAVQVNLFCLVANLVLIGLAIVVIVCIASQRL